MVMTLKPVQKKVENPAPQEAPQGPSASQSKVIALDSVDRMFCPKCEQKMNTSSVPALTEGRCPSCGEKVLVHGKVGAYRVMKLIGQGGMGAVYEGFDAGLGRKVAIKVTLVDVKADKNLLETFQREAQVVAKLNHPNVVQVYTFGEEKGHPYLVMELLPAGSLLDRAGGEEPLSIPFIMGVALEVAEGLNAAHEAGLLHGDIKPENILFDDKMHAKLVDFGLAAIGVSAGGEVWGTPYYIAPEKVLERKANHKCDIYSFGATLYHAVAKHPPFEGTDGTAVIKAALEGKVPPLSTVRPDVPPEVEDIISRMMEKNVTMRYPNYKSIIADIKKYLASVPQEQWSRASRLVPQGPKRTAAGTSRMPTQGVQKPTAGTKKILVQGTVPPAGITTQFTSDTDERAGGTTGKGKSKAPMIAVAAGVGLLLLGALGYFMTHQAAKSQKSLVEEAQKMEAASNKVRTSLSEALHKIDKINANAQKMVSLVKSQESKWKSGDENRRKQAEQAIAAGQRIQTLFLEADGLCTQVEQLKFDSILPEAIDQQEIDSRKKSLSAQLEHGKTVKAKVEEIEQLFGTIQVFTGPTGSDLGNSSSGGEDTSIAGSKVLAKGTGRDAVGVNLSKHTGLKEVKLSAGESVVLAIWKADAGDTGGGVLKEFQISRKDGKKASFFGMPLSTAIGSFSLRGLAKRDQFPSVDRVMEAQPGSKMGEFIFPSVGGLGFMPLNDNSGLSLTSSGRSGSDSKFDWAPAVVFTAKDAGVYAVEGSIVLKSGKPQANLSWMVWAAQLN